jgi:hypothetical protein
MMTNYHIFYVSISQFILARVALQALRTVKGSALRKVSAVGRLLKPEGKSLKSLKQRSLIAMVASV